VEERPVGRSAVGVRQRRCHQPRLPQDTDAIVSCQQMSLAMSSVNLNRWQLQEATLVCRSICSTSAVTGLTAVGDRQRGRYFASCYAPTINDVEGWHHRLNAKASHGRLNSYRLLQLLHDEARLVTLAVRLLSECGTSQMQRKSYAQLHSRIFQLWDEYSDGSRSASSLLSACSRMCRR